MESHEGDLRAEVQDARQVELIQTDFRKTQLDGPTMLLLDFAVKLTLRPTEMHPDNIATLRSAGFTDETILAAVQTIAYFNYANRVMDALGIEPEPEMRFMRRPLPKR